MHYKPTRNIYKYSDEIKGKIKFFYFAFIFTENFVTLTSVFIIYLIIP